MGLISVLILGLHCREEHTKRHSCGFLSLTKDFDDLTMEEYYMLEMTRLRTFLVSAKQIILIHNSKLEDKQELPSLRFPSISKGCFCKAGT